MEQADGRITAPFATFLGTAAWALGKVAGISAIGMRGSHMRRFVRPYAAFQAKHAAERNACTFRHLPAVLSLLSVSLALF